MRPPVRVDSVPPVIEFVSPRAGNLYDRDGDGLVDIVISLSDSGSGIDVGSLDVRFFSSARGVGQSVFDLARVTYSDADSVVLTESIQAPFSSGPVPIFASVVDSAGNESSATVSPVFSPMDFHREIDTGLSGRGFADGLGYCEDDGLLYVTAETWLIIVDPVDLTVVDRIPPPDGVAGAFNSSLFDPLCFPGDSILYIADFELSRFDRKNRVWLSDVPGKLGVQALSPSEIDTSVFYAGLSSFSCGRIARFDRSVQDWVSVFPDLQPPCGSTRDVALSSGDRELFVGRSTGAPLVVDPGTETVKDSVSEINPSPSMAISLDRQFVYIVDEGSGGRIAEVSSEGHSVVRSIVFPASEDPFFLGLSNDGSRLWLSTRGASTYNYLVDVADFSILARFERPNFDPVNPRTDRGSWFEPDDNYVIVIRNYDLDVYVNRR